MLRKRAVTSQPIHDLIAGRWSPRAYDASRPVAREHLLALLEAARWAPSCNGAEPWRYLVFDRARDPEGWQRMFDCLSENNRKWAGNVPVFLLGCAATTFEHSGKPNRFAQYDTGMATLSLSIQAESLGLVVHQMAGYDTEAARAAFAIPADFTLMALVAVGYQGDPAILDEETRAKETRAHVRKPLAERFFEGGWGRGVAEG